MLQKKSGFINSVLCIFFVFVVFFFAFRWKLCPGLVVNIIWGLHSIAALGIAYESVVNIFVRMMITIGTGRCSMYRNNVCNINYMP